MVWGRKPPQKKQKLTAFETISKSFLCPLPGFQPKMRKTTHFGATHFIK
jgi:hypothetical protein